MARFSKKKVIKKKSVNKNKNKNTRGRKRVSRGKSIRRVKRKYGGGVDKYIILKKDKIKYYDYAKMLAELIYRVLHIIFILSENKDMSTKENKTEVLQSLLTNYNDSGDSTKREKITVFLNKLLDIVLKSNYTKTGGGELNFKTYSSKYTVTRTTASGLTELGFLQEFGIVMARADADELSYFLDTDMPESVSQILTGESGNSFRITSTAPTEVIPTFSTFLKHPETLPSNVNANLAGHILLATKAAIDTVDNVSRQSEPINFDLVLKRVGDLSLEEELDIFLAKMGNINDLAKAAFETLVESLES